VTTHSACSDWGWRIHPPFHCSTVFWTGLRSLGWSRSRARKSTFMRSVWGRWLHQARCLGLGLGWTSITRTCSKTGRSAIVRLEWGSWYPQSRLHTLRECMGCCWDIWPWSPAVFEKTVSTERRRERWPSSLFWTDWRPIAESFKGWIGSSWSFRLFHQMTTFWIYPASIKVNQSQGTR